MLDPVAAYGRMADSFARISELRRPYLQAVERLIVQAIPKGSSSLLDIGAGDGRRAIAIAQAAALKNVILLEPSAEMRKNWLAGVTAWPMRAEELRTQSGAFDVITCLWNVLGHIFPASARGDVLRQSARLLARGGRMFADVSHRYNASHYGFWPTAWRFLRGGSGDVIVTWREQGIATAGHVFRHREFAELCRTAGLEVERRFVLDYATGALRRWSWQGHLLYVLRHGGDFSGGDAGEKRQG
ncbi:MAG TPA: methyltransferase domain-containing protein [Bryobacteraceae bacterium]|nr:methyltransferase domain-containing protein [Bryobacteraceae bacterium]